MIMQLSLQEFEKLGRLLPPFKGESRAHKLSRGVTITQSHQIWALNGVHANLEN
jgi:hypothetical protein